MNRKIFLITVFIFLIIGISAVSAEDINKTDDSLEISDSDVISDNSPKSFSDLGKAIGEGSQEGLNIISDYEFNNATDDAFKNGLTLNVDPDGTYTINGNNHVIDAKNQAGIFKFNNGTFIINNLKLCNAKISSIILNDCELRTNNVTFENNNDSIEGSAISAYQSNYYSSHDKFINNYAPNGASIYAYKSIVDINNSTFTNDKIYWSLIYGYDSVMTVKNTVFANMTSRYATAIYLEENEVKSKLTVLNSKFINLKANATAGAIGSKSTDSITIDGCSFINVTSAKNAGAVYADINGGKTNPDNTVTISNSLFENCSSNFGGAYLQLGGKLNLAKTDFVNNIAQYMGGAVYLSNATVLIGNSKFNKNNATINYGGAIYIDDSNCIITSNEFSNNFAGTYGDAIYLHDSKYNIKNCDFTNGDKEAIVSFFDRQGCSLSNNVLNGGKTLLNQVSYNTIVSYEGKQIVLIPNPVTNATAKDSIFDLRNYEVNGNKLSGTVKDQGNNGACWAFGATGALESAFLKATGILLDLSENNIQGAATRYSEFGTGIINEGGFGISGMSLFLSWLSVFSTEFDSYDELGKISIASFVPDYSYHIQDAIIIPPRESALDNDKLKDALVKYGGLTVHVYGASANNNYYNPTTHAQYYNGQGYGNHFVTLVGWNDTYSKDNFKITPPGDGAWICKNSWGSNWGENGYFYVSYYDKTFAMTSSSVGYIINNTENYTCAYQYDIGYVSFYNDKEQNITFTNTYDAIDNELISAVGTYFVNAGDKYTVKIFVDGAEVYSQDGFATHGGFETIKLNKKIAVTAGHKFSVQIQAKNLPYLDDTRIHIENGKSMAYYTDGTVEDLGKLKKAAGIKAYTVKNDDPKESNTQYYNKNSNVTISSNANGKTISIVNAKDGKTLGSATVKDGKATFNFTLEPGSYAIAYDDSDIIEGFEIMNTIEVIDSIKIGYNAPLTIEAAFYDEDGIELFGSDITVILDGENYTETIEDIDGILYLTLNDLSIGNHTLILINPETDEESVTTIEVVSRFTGNSDVNMYYADGSSFKVRAYDNNGNPVGANEIVKITLNNVIYNVKTDSNGYAILNIPNTVKPGKYTLTATYKDQIIKNTVKVTQVLKLGKVKVKKSAKKLVIKATLKKGKTPIKNQKLTFKFNGKKYSAKTNNKGIAKITIKKSVLKKLKVGNKVKYQVTYLKVTVKQSVKVKK